MKRVFRLDDRLVHGQTINYWCGKYNIKSIFVLDDILEKDEMKKLFFKLSVPSDIKLSFISIEEGINLNHSIDEKAIFIFGNVNSVIKYLKCGGNMDILNIGYMGYEQNKKQISTGTYLSEEEEKALNMLKEKYNIKIEYKMMPN